MFIEFQGVDEASFALSALDGHPFDAKHIFKINRFSDIERYTNLDETYAEPKAEEYKPRVSFLRGLICFSALIHILIRNI